MVSFLLSCRSGAGFAVDLRPPSDVSAHVGRPTLVLASRNDGSVDGSHPRRLVDTLPDARLVRVPRAAHFAYVERPHIVWPEVERFLGERIWFDRRAL